MRISGGMPRLRFLVYVAGYRDEGTLLRFAELAYERYLTPSTGLHGNPNLAAQRRIMCDDRCGELKPDIPGVDEEWFLEG